MIVTIQHNLRSLLSEIARAKAQEREAQQRRHALEDQLAQLLTAPEEGQKKHRIDEYSVVRENKYYYKGNIELLRPLCQELEIDLPVKEAINETALKRLRKASPTTFEILESEKAVTRTAARPSFQISIEPC